MSLVEICDFQYKDSGDRFVLCIVADYRKIPQCHCLLECRKGLLVVFLFCFFFNPHGNQGTKDHYLLNVAYLFLRNEMLYAAFPMLSFV